MAGERTHNPIEDYQPVPGTVLIVDDVPGNLDVLGELLRASHYRVKAANAGPAALRFASRAPVPDLIMLDVMMPGMDGYEVLGRLQADPATREIPVIFLTALGEARDEERGLLLGAADYITKPLQPAVVLARVRAQLEAKRARDWMRDQNAALESEVVRRVEENTHSQAVAIRALAHLAEMRDSETGNHILRTQAYVGLLAKRLAGCERFRGTLTPAYVDLLVRSAPLHDIGKVGIPDQILLKSGKLTPEEWEVMKSHAALGAEAIERAERDAERPVAFLAIAKEIARSHHERWDGRGYPDGLAGEAIPVSARLMALADVFDALVTPRVYKKPVGVEQARRIILAERGAHFDPDVVDAFDQGYEDFVETARRQGDRPVEPAPA